MNRPLKATINIASLQHNLACVRKKAPTSRIWAVVKARAYGHRLEHVFSGLQETDGFALLEIEEAICLRKMGWTGPILLLEGIFSIAEIQLISQYQLTVVVNQSAQLESILKAFLKAPIDIYIKINTGMNRLGFSAAEVLFVLEQAKASVNIRKIAVMTHFANADRADGIALPLEKFTKSIGAFKGERSAANSAAILWHPESHFEWVRPGIMLFGASPSGDMSVVHQEGLRPVMTLSSEIIAVQMLKTGDEVGYGSTYRAERPMRIGVVACGYADGYPRIAPNGTPIIVDGVRTQIVGRVSMDMLTVDLTPCPQANVGTPVELWGTQLLVDEVAAQCQTVGYELLTSLAIRVPIMTQ